MQINQDSSGAKKEPGPTLRRAQDSGEDKVGKVLEEAGSMASGRPSPDRPTFLDITDPVFTV